MNNLDNIFTEAKKASFSLSTASTKQKNDILSAVAKAISKDMETILSANRTDIENARERVFITIPIVPSFREIL